MTAVATKPGTATTGGGALAGTWTLVRFMLRRDRIRIAAWILGITVLTVSVAANLTQTYPTAAERQVIAETMDTPASVAMVGVNYGADDYHYGVMMGHQMLAFSVVVVGLMSVLLVVRHTRAEEAAGRAELVRGAVVGRHATTTAALIVVAAVNLVLAAALAVGLGSTGLEGITWEGSWLYGAAHAAVGLVFAGVAAVTAQLTEHSRGASGIAIAMIGLAYVERAVGDVGDGRLSWISPISWAQATEVYVTNRWWPLLLAMAFTALLVADAFVLSTRRDVGAGLRASRGGTPAASAVLANPFGFAFRLHRASLIAWAAGLFLLGASYGSVLGEVERWLTDVEAMADLLPELQGVSVTEAFAAMVTTVMAIGAAVYAVLAAQRMRSEETAGRVEPVLATGLSRTRWVASHLAVATVGSLAVLAAGGLGLGLTGAAITDDPSLRSSLLGAALAYAPALWLTTAVLVALFGLLPRAIGLTWIVVLYSFIVVYLGGFLEFPEWMRNLSPFGHVPQLPADDFALAPLAVLTAIAAALIAVGLFTFRRRDLQSPS